MRIRSDLKIEKQFYPDLHNFWNVLRPKVDSIFAAANATPAPKPAAKTIA